MADCIVLPPRDLWPVGFRFRPTDEELINHYLKNKILGKESLVQYIPQVDICKHEPWELPSLSNDHTSEQEWFFFSAQNFKYSNGSQSNRATGTGYWKSTGRDRKIMPPGTKKLIGTKKTLVFYRGRVPNGFRTNWVIHEYHLHSDPNFVHVRSFVICLLKRKPDENNQAEPNGLVNLTFENVATVNQNQEILGNGQSLFQPDLQVLDYEFPELQSPLFSDPEPISMDFQAFNSYGTRVNGPTDEDIDTDENCFHQGTPNSSISDFNWEELFHSVNQNQGDGFRGDTGMDATLSWQYDHASHSLFGEHTRSGVQTQSMPIIKESRRSPLASKILKYGGGKDLSSARRPLEDEQQINCISYLSDDSGREIRTFRRQRQPKPHKVVNDVNASQNVQSKRETQLQVVSSPDKAKAVSNEDIVACRSKSTTGHGSVESRKKCSKCIHHKSSAASAYAARACIGLILFIIVARQVLLYGNW